MTRFQNVEIRIVQGENMSRSTSWSNQTSINLYKDIQRSGRSESALMPWPGEKPFSVGTAGKKTRGFRVVNGIPYILTDTSLYRIREDGSQIFLAKVPGSRYVSMADDGFNLMIRNSGTVTFLNQKFILAGNGATFLWNTEKLVNILTPDMVNPGEYVATMVDSTTEFQAIGEARLLGDDIVQIYAFQKKVIMGGERSIEIFYDEGGVPQPIVPIPQAATNQIGVASAYSMAETPDYLYMLGADGLVYRLVNFELMPVTTSAIAKELDQADKTDAQGFTCQIDGQWFYILRLPFGNMTLAFSEKTGEWCRLSSGTAQPPQEHLISGFGIGYGRRLVADNNSSDVYEWDFNTFTSNGGIIVRQFDTAPINGSMVGAPGQRLVAKRVRFIMQTGVGSKLDRDPQMMVSYSIDGGRSFSDEQWLKMKREGESTAIVNWHLHTTFYDIQFRVRISDPVFTSFHSGAIELKPAGY